VRTPPPACTDALSCDPRLARMAASAQHFYAQVFSLPGKLLNWTFAGQPAPRAHPVDAARVLASQATSLAQVLVIAAGVLTVAGIVIGRHRLARWYHRLVVP